MSKTTPDQYYQYWSYCESLWKDWKDQKIKLPNNQKNFDLEYCPEPYLLFGGSSREDSEKYLHFLTTNPGGGMEEQCWDRVTHKNFSSNAKKLADFYLDKLKGSAHRRITAMRSLSKQVYEDAYKGFIQVECIPFHSKSLPNKNRLVAAGGSCNKNTCLSGYKEVLKEYLNDKNVLAISAVSSTKDLCKDAFPDSFSEWLKWQTNILKGFSDTKRYPICCKEGKATGILITNGATFSKGEPVKGQTFKGIFLMMGGNHLPSEERIKEIACILRGEKGKECKK